MARRIGRKSEKLKDFLHRAEGDDPSAEGSELCILDQEALHTSPSMSTTQNAGPSWLAPYEVCHGLDTVRRRQAKLERHEILHHLRGSLEEHHRNQLETFQIHHPHLLKDMSHIGEIMGLNYWNKTVPIFLLKDPAGRAGYPEMLRPALHNYLYRRWFRPYRTDRV
ncbi:hypothetical protein FALCPG4_009414 [Fusarium falciforme]